MVSRCLSTELAIVQLFGEIARRKLVVAFSAGVESESVTPFFLIIDKNNQGYVPPSKGMTIGTWTVPAGGAHSVVDT